MRLKASILIGLVLVGSLIVGSFFLVGHFFEPLDPFPRAAETAKCASGSSVALYQRKTGWFTSETVLLVRLIDGNGEVMQRRRLGTFRMWNDSEMKVRETPETLCDQQSWPWVFDLRGPALLTER